MPSVNQEQKKARVHTARLSNNLPQLPTSRVDPDTPRFPNYSLAPTQVAKVPPEVDLRSTSLRL